MHGVVWRAQGVRRVCAGRAEWGSAISLPFSHSPTPVLPPLGSRRCAAGSVSLDPPHSLPDGPDGCAAMCPGGRCLLAGGASHVARARVAAASTWTGIPNGDGGLETFAGSMGWVQLEVRCTITTTLKGGRSNRCCLCGPSGEVCYKAALVVL